MATPAAAGGNDRMLPDRFQTPRLILRPITPADRDPIFDTYVQDPEVTRYLIWRPHRSREETSSYIADCLATPPASARTYVLTGRETGSLLGAFHLRRPAPHRLECGYVLGRPWWGRGLMTEALTEIVDWALCQESVFRIGAVCDIENAASARVMEKSGLVREGMQRRLMIHPNVSDEPRDCFLYGRAR
jgi:ribosomal-protein-alanine N-acetyltransferase